MPYDNMPFKNKQAAKSDRYAKLSAGRASAVESYNAQSKHSPEDTKAYYSKINKFDQEMKKANPTRFAEDVGKGYENRARTETYIDVQGENKKVSMPSELIRSGKTLKKGMTGF